ncbi:hypothetical protein HF888_11200 [Bermanella marisrubri]|uniref:DUF2007 domain-containing protein n=1 Tax=Bermanella marisrubri TaxID=207949 RepID=Q1N1A7_9GAMM|nr:DUF6164 family protein [Bermanella marisrubri]EAT11944.1 hypothetical protein RED65_11405 [Oceanobacter sp. RED65] [Bermanella marisrubri]QIZ84749.1 hypothetical protein HF888_11200 [Bermanella marisrubri]
MAQLLLKLRNVPEDEYLEVCQLLNDNDIPFYETNVGFWGIGVAAIWLNRDDDLPQAQQLLSEYMEQRQRQAQADYQAAIESGTQRTWWSTFSQQPFMFILYILIIGFILGLTIMPFLSL